LSEVVCDTSPLQYLYQLDLLDLLPVLATRIFVPPAVQEELSVGRSLGIKVPAVEELSWAAVRRPESHQAIPLIHDLGAGETEVLLLALELPGTIAVLDDALARRVAGSLKIPFTGTLGLLIDAKKANLISAVGPCLDALHALRFRISPGTRSAVLKIVGESED
jgi:predicted nucleic acid-binding protein